MLPARYRNALGEAGIGALQAIVSSTFRCDNRAPTGKLMAGGLIETCW